jgi:hypothetical protein
MGERHSPCRWAALPRVVRRERATSPKQDAPTPSKGGVNVPSGARTDATYQARAVTASEMTRSGAASVDRTDGVEPLGVEVIAIGDSRLRLVDPKVWVDELNLDRGPMSLPPPSVDMTRPAERTRP